MALRRQIGFAVWLGLAVSSALRRKTRDMGGIVAILLLLFSVGTSTDALGKTTFDEIVGLTSAACIHPEQLLTNEFTNRINTLRLSSTTDLERRAADLSLSISLFHRLNCDQEEIGSKLIFDLHQEITSNLYYSAVQAPNDWIRKLPLTRTTSRRPHSCCSSVTWIENCEII